MSVTPGVQVRCRICGEHEFIAKGNEKECRYCGATYMVYDPGLEAELRMADSFRESAQFDVAAGLYHRIIQTYNGHNLSDAYWGLFLCEQRVMFETDTNGKRFPSFYAMTAEAADCAQSLSKAVEHAAQHDPARAELLRDLGEKVCSAKELYRRIYGSSKPYDLFICFKKSDFDSNTTDDTELATDLYNHLAKDYNIFFSERSLSKSAVRDWEPNIYYGLYTAKVMLLLCSKRDFVESQWVKNEWSRYHTFTQNPAAGKTIIPIFLDDFQPSDLPAELQGYQGLKDNRHLFDDLTATLRKIIKPVDMEAELKRQLAEQQRRIDEQQRQEAERAEAQRHQIEEQQRQMQEQLEAMRKAQEQLETMRKSQEARFIAPKITTTEPLSSSSGDFEIHNGKLAKYHGKGGHVIVPYGVTHIGKGAFAKNYRGTTTRGGVNCDSNKELLSVTLPESVTSIDDHAFYWCHTLERISLPQGLTHIGKYAFCDCKALTDLTLPNSLTNIDDGAFCHCKNIKSITIPNAITIIKKGTFKGCANLTNVSLPNNTTSIGEEAFYDCSSLTSILIPDNVTNIGKSAFHSSKISNIKIPKSMTTIGDFAFYGCSALTTIIIPEGVTSIEKSAFQSCGEVTSITLPKTLTSIHEDAFLFCGRNITSIQVSEGNPVFHSANNCLIHTESKTLFRGANNSIIPTDGSVTIIGQAAFKNSAFKTIKIPNCITKIGEAAFNFSNLTNISIPESVTEIDDSAFCHSDLTDITLSKGLKSIGEGAFYGCKNLTNIILPETVTDIDSRAFYECINLTSVTISKKLKNIGQNAFYECTKLTEINAPFFKKRLIKRQIKQKT